MSEANLRQIRVLHIVSAGGVATSLQSSLFMPLLTRLPRQRVKAQVACLSPGAVPSAVLRQNGVPTFDLALSRKRFSPKAFNELQQSARHFRPDVIQAWGHTAQVIATMLRKRCEWKPRLVWSLTDTAPLVKDAGFIDRQKLKYAAKFAARADRIVYTSEAAAAQHRRVGFPDGGHETVPPGVDATRYKPDFAARRKLREELSLPGETFVVGMVAPFQPEFDHATFLKAIGELVKANPNIAVVLAGHGVQKGNAPLMALVGGGSLATRVHLLGEWSDVSALYNACDIVCSSAVNDQARMNVVMAMLCGVPCVATGIGAQGEVIGQHGVAIEPGNPAAFVKGITRVMQMPPEKRTHMAQGARKHALTNYVYVRSLQKYLQLYYDLIGRQSLVSQDLPTPEIDAALTVPPALPSEAEMNAGKRKPITVVDLSDPDSLESRVAERAADELPKWRIEQEEERNKREAELAAQVAASKTVGDVLQVFESEQAKAAASETPMTERARGVADDSEELLSPDLLAAEAPPPPRASHAASSSRKSASPAPAPAAPAQDAAKQAALKAARMAALQPIAPSPRPVAAPKASAAVARPPVTKVASPVTRPPVSDSPISASTPVTRPPASTPAPDSVTKPAASNPLTRPPASVPAAEPVSIAASTPAPEPAKADQGGAQHADMLPEFPLFAPADSDVPATPEAEAAAVDSSGTQPLEMLPEIALLPPVEPSVSAAPVAEPEKQDAGDAQLPEMLPEIALFLEPKPAAEPPQVEEPASTQSQEMLPQALELPSMEQSATALPTEPNVSVSSAGDERNVSASVAESKKTDLDSTQPMGTFAQALANATQRLAAFRLADMPKADSLERPADTIPAVSSGAAAAARPASTGVTAAAEKSAAPTNDASAAPAAASIGQDSTELALMATGQWMAMQRPESKPAVKADKSKLDELSGAEALSLISTPAADAKSEPAADPTLKLAQLPEPKVEPKRAANGK